MHGRDAIGGLIDARGHIRTPWRPVIDAMQAIGVEEFATRAAALDRRMRYEQPGGAVPAQRLDPIPVPLMDHEFSAIAEAIVERAHCLDWLLDDLYGPQTSIERGLIPGAAIFGSPEFVRQLARQPAMTGPRLAFYAVDLARDPDGEFRIVRDHTDQAPGLGLALAIRRLVAGVLPELFGAVTLVSQRPVTETLQDMLHALAGDSPIGLVARVGAGAGADMGATLADTRLLARQIGGIVLRPDDLSCADGGVRLRTLAGSTDIKLLVRRGSSIGIDPLEQGGAPNQGIAGIFRALRHNNAVVLNAPGSAIVQTPVLAAVFRDVFVERYGREPRLGVTAGQATTGLNADQAPIAVRAADGPRKAMFDVATVTLRMFALKIEGVWRVLPGGLGYAARPDGNVLVKDVWIIDSGVSRPDELGPLQRQRPGTAHREATDLPSRLADDLLWLGRTVERLDAASRLLAVTLPRFADASNLPHEAAQRDRLAACLVSAKLLPGETAGPFLSARRLHDSLARRRPLMRLVDDIRELLDHCGERFSLSMRSIVEAALDQIPIDQDGEAGTFTACMQFVATFNGVIAEDASHSGGFVFLEIGRRLERAEALADTLTILLAGALARLDPGLSLAIELADAQLSYEFIHAGPLLPAPAIALLIGAKDYPRSVAYQTEALGVALRRIGAADQANAIADLTARLTALSGAIAAGEPADIGAVLRATASRLEALAADLVARYFSAVPPARQVDDGTES